MTQANVKLVDTDGSDLGPIIGNSNDGGSILLVIASNVAAGPDQECRSCMLWTPANDVAMKIDKEETAAEASDFLLLQNILFPIPVSNLKYLRFHGGTDASKIYVLWRN
jgi:hypothetical protein